MKEEAGKEMKLILCLSKRKRNFFLEVTIEGHTGLNHLAFQASSKEQVDNLTKKLQEKGIEILYKKRHPFAGGEQHYAVFFEDPDRIKVELVAPFT